MPPRVMADFPDLPPLPADPAPTEGPVSPISSSPAAPPRRRSALGSLWTLLVRLVILGAGVSLGGLAGMAVAQVWPARTPEPPPLEVALRHSGQTLRKLRQLPRWWQGKDGVADPAADPAPSPSTSDDPEATPIPAAILPADAGAATPIESVPGEAVNRDRLQTELTRLQQDVASVDARLQTLETTLGTPPLGTFEERLQRLDQRLDAEVSPAAADPAPGPAAPAPVAETLPLVSPAEPRFPLVSDRVVLPSALLFEPGSSVLTAPGQQLLDSIAPDLRRYGPVTLLIGSHTDPTVAPTQASQLTLQQSLAVQQYLAPQVDIAGVRWVPVGYGYTRPRTTGATPADQQRNQRVEIGVVPGS